MNPYLPLPGEIYLKQFLMEEAERDGVCLTAVFNRIKRKRHYPGLKTRKAGYRTVFVTRPTP